MDDLMSATVALHSLSGFKEHEFDKKQLEYTHS